MPVPPHPWPGRASPRVRLGPTIVTDASSAARAFTGGYFDARAAPGGGLDPSGLVKGWSVEV
jgi:hypothetical protein